MATKTTIPPEMVAAHDLITSEIGQLQRMRTHATRDADPVDQAEDMQLAARIGGLSEALSLMFRAVVESGKAS